MKNCLDLNITGNSKTSFPKRLELTDKADVCLGFFKALSIYFVWELK